MEKVKEILLSGLAIVDRVRVNLKPESSLYRIHRIAVTEGFTNWKELQILSKESAGNVNAYADMLRVHYGLCYIPSKGKYFSVPLVPDPAYLGDVGVVEPVPFMSSGIPQLFTNYSQVKASVIEEQKKRETKEAKKK